MKLKKLALACVCAALCSTQALAQDGDPWDASVSLGYVGTTGNTDTTTFNTEMLLKIRTDNWTHSGKFQALGAQENDVAKAERYYVEDKSDYNIDDMQYVFGKGTYTDDRFSGFEYQASLAAGYGRYLIRREGLTLQAFGGPGYRENSLIGGDSEGEGIMTVGESLAWQISPNAALTQSLSSDIGEDLSVSRFELGLETNIIGDVTTKIAFQARHTSEVPLGTENTDTITSIGLAYAF